MQFWLRHAFLLLCCVVVPFVAALYVDTSSEIRRSERAGAVAARFASANLESRLTLDAHKSVNAALALAQRVADRDLAGELAKRPNEKAGTAEKRREAALSAISEIIRTAAPPGGFAWLVDESGAIVARTDPAANEEKPQQITGHPLFAATQEGFALDGLWKEGDRVAMVGAAPVMSKNQAAGAVVVGTPLDRSLVDALSSALNCKLTLVGDGKILASTLEPDVASAIIQELGDSSEPTSGGFLSKKLEHDSFPILPVFIEHDARGFAFTSLSLRVAGAEDMRWVISAPAAEGLRALAERQVIVLGGLGAFFMLALLIGMINHRTFVRPIGQIAAHLSELNQGRGELELPEGSVSGPFRRLVKLINMMVQRIPSRGFVPTRASTSAESPISEIGAPPLPSVSSMAAHAREAAAREASGSPYASKGGALELDAVLPAAPLAASRDGSVSLRETVPPPVPAQGGPPAGRMAIPASSSILEKHPFDGGDAFADAVASIARGDHSGAARPAKSKGGGDDEADAIAEAIASLEAEKNPVPTVRGQAQGGPPAGQVVRGNVVTPPASALEAPKSPAGRTIRSAADIRGVPSESISGGPTPFSPSASEVLRQGSGFGPRTDASMDERTPIDQQISAAARAHSTTARSGGSLNLASYAGIGASVVEEGGFNPEATVVAPVADELLRKSASREDTTDHHAVIPNIPAGDMTMVASVPANLLAQTVGDQDGEGEGSDLVGLDAADHAHFKETYERFIEMRKRCGEATGDLAFDRFLAKLAKNREGLIKKYNCRTVRFQVYEKDGKAALKATPVRAR